MKSMNSMEGENSPERDNFQFDDEEEEEEDEEEQMDVSNEQREGDQKIHEIQDIDFEQEEEEDDEEEDDSFSSLEEYGETVADNHPLTQDIQQRQQQQRVQQEEQSSSLDWTCVKCTFMNINRAHYTCMMCGQIGKRLPTQNYY